MKEKYEGKISALGGIVENSVKADTLLLVSDKGRRNTSSICVYSSIYFHICLYFHMCLFINLANFDIEYHANISI